MEFVVGIAPIWVAGSIPSAGRGAAETKHSTNKRSPLAAKRFAKKMKGLAPPDVIVWVGLAVSITALVVFLGWPTKDAYGPRTFAFMALPVFHTLVAISWWAGGRSWRLAAFRVYYRFFGPRCHIWISGIIHVDSAWDDGGFADKGLFCGESVGF